METHEDLPGVKQGQIEHEEQQQGETWTDVQEKQCRQEHAQYGCPEQRSITGIDPEESRQAQPRRSPHAALCILEQFLKRQDSIRSRETVDLHGEREKGSKIDECEQLQEKPASQLLFRVFFEKPVPVESHVEKLFR